MERFLIAHCSYLQFTRGIIFVVKQLTPHPLPNEQYFSLGSRVCTYILNPAVMAPHKLSLPISHVSSSCSRVAKSYKPRSSCKTWLWWGTDMVHACPGNSIPNPSQAVSVVWGDIAGKIVVVKQLISHPLTNEQRFSLGSRVCTSILNPAVLAPHKLSLPISYVPSSFSPEHSHYITFWRWS